MPPSARSPTTHGLRADDVPAPAFDSFQLAALDGTPDRPRCAAELSRQRLNRVGGRRDGGLSVALGAEQRSQPLERDRIGLQFGNKCPQ
jgi:hypothetical protein